MVLLSSAACYEPNLPRRYVPGGFHSQAGAVGPTFAAFVPRGPSKYLTLRHIKDGDIVDKCSLLDIKPLILEVIILARTGCRWITGKSAQQSPEWQTIQG